MSENLNGISMNELIEQIEHWSVTLNSRANQRLLEDEFEKLDIPYLV